MFQKVKQIWNVCLPKVVTFLIKKRYFLKLSDCLFAGCDLKFGNEVDSNDTKILSVGSSDFLFVRSFSCAINLAATTFLTCKGTWERLSHSRDTVITLVLMRKILEDGRNVYSLTVSREVYLETTQWIMCWGRPQSDFHLVLHFSFLLKTHNTEFKFNLWVRHILHDLAQPRGCFWIQSSCELECELAVLCPDL